MAFAGPSSRTQAAMRRVRGRLEAAADFDAYDDPVATTSYGVAGPFRPRGGAGIQSVSVGNGVQKCDS